MKDCVKNANIRFWKDKTSKYQSSSKLINDDTMEKSAPITEKINIQLNDVRKESRRRFCESKEKNGKSVPIETEYPIIENAGSSSIRQLKKGTTLIVGDFMLAGIEEKRISGNRSVKVRIFPGATTHDMFDYLKPLLKKNPDIILHVGTNNSMNETSRHILKHYLWKTLLKNCVQHAKL